MPIDDFVDEDLNLDLAKTEEELELERMIAELDDGAEIVECECKDIEHAIINPPNT